MSQTGKHTYGQILKSSALIGGSSALNIGLRIIRTKAMALILGPAGVGLLGLYGSISDLTRCIAGMGINGSGVRQIAEAVGTGDAERISRTVTTLRRVALCSGILGGLLLILLCKPVSWLTFHDLQHISPVALLAVAVFLDDVSAGQGALLQGMRRISDLAAMNILGALYGTLFSIPIVYFFHEKGVVPSLICVAAMGIVTSWWYARKVKVVRQRLPFSVFAAEAGALLKLGVVFMASGFMTLGAAYLIRVIILHRLDLEAAGCFQAAWALGGLYVGFILQAMGMDFFPRLTAVANNNPECNRLVNEQAEVGLLLAGPGALATLTFAPTVIQLFYSDRFAPAVQILRWICLGMTLRVASWPMGFILVAKGERKLFFWTEFGCNLLFVAFVLLGVRWFGLNGSGMAFFATYLIYWLGIYLVVRRLSGFRWSRVNKRLALWFLPPMASVYLSWYFAPPIVATLFGAIVTVLASIYSLRTLCTLISVEQLPAVARWFLRVFRLAPPNGLPKQTVS